MDKNKPDILDVTSSLMKKIVYSETSDNETNYISNWVSLIMDANLYRENMPFKQPFRTQNPQIVLITSGTATYSINYIKHELKQGVLLCLPIGTNFSIYQKSQDFNMHILDFKIPKHMTQNFFLFQLDIFKLNTTTNARIKKYFSLLQDCIKEERRSSVEHIIFALLYDIKQLKEECNNTMQLHQTSSEILYCQFMQLLLSDQDRLHRAPSFYAGHFAKSPNYFSYTIKHISGLSVKEWITRVTLDSAKILLRETDLSINEISKKLGYSTPSSFCRIFKQREYVSPNDFRNTHHDIE
ncbi:MAG: helix-turn-helix transcriptional regulator [Bacteroidales bacterium]|nr:helix-turn-helix transcriptional regulator [Bacteroidales bacterium]